VSLLWAGFSFRRREKRIFAIWSLLKRNAEISAPGLLANSDFERPHLEHAVRFLNNRGLGHYVWDRETDTILDARLQSSLLHVEKCDACGASIALDVPVAFREVPRCPHCDDPVSVESLEERRDAAIEALREEHRARRDGSGSGSGARGSFSPVIFLLLLFAFWPAALVYAWFKWQGKL
jgi:hypothetical protein